MSDPVIVHIRTRKSFWMGVLFSVFGLLWSVMFGAALWITAEFSFGLFLAFAPGPLSGLLGLWFLGIALKRPVALRMDSHGISGFYADPATWDEITDIGTFDDYNRNRFVGFAVQDPIALRDRQTPWGRLKSHSSGRSFGYHIAVPETLLNGTDAETLATRAKALHAAATSV